MLNIKPKIKINEKLENEKSGSLLFHYNNVGKSAVGDIKCTKENNLSCASKMDSTDDKKKKKKRKKLMKV